MYPLPRLCLALILLLTAGPATTGLPAQEGWPALFQDVTEVRVLSVDVFVTDAAGDPVTGLTRDDFVLRVDGEPVPISNFFAVENGHAAAASDLPASAGKPAEVLPEVPAVGASAEPPSGEPDAVPEERRLHLIVYVDHANLDPTNRRRVLAHLKDYLLAAWRPDLRVMVISNDRSLVVRQPLTSTPHDVFVALDEVEKTQSFAPRFDLDFRDLISAIEAVNVEEGSGLFGTKGRLSDLQSPNRGDVDLTGVESQEKLTAEASNHAKSLLPRINVYSQQLMLHVQQSLRSLSRVIDTAAGLPGRKSVIYISDGLSMRPAEALLEGFSRRFNSLGDVGANVAAQVESSRDDSRRAFEELVTRANASQVTFYTLDAAPPAAMSRGSAASTGSAGGNFGTWDDSMAATEQRNRQESLVSMAEATGGRYGLSRSTFDDVLDSLLTDFDNFYSLGYRPSSAGDDRRQKIEVRTRDRALRLRYSTSSRPKSATQRMEASVLSALLFDEDRNPLGIALDAQEPVPGEDGHFLVPLMVKVPLGKLVLVPGDSEHTAKVSMFVAARDGEGRISDVVHHLCPIRIPNSDVLTALGRSMTCGVRLAMRGGPQRVAVAVRDEVAKVESVAHLELDVREARRTTDEAP